MSEHAKFAPSAAARWLECPGSIRLSEGLPNPETKYSLEGTAAHHLLSRCLEHGENPYALVGELDFGTKIRYDTEMAFFIKACIEYIELLSGTRYIEYRVEHSPEHFGTVDILIINNNKMTVIDFKYGAGIRVEVQDNAQLLSYAAMAFDRFSVLYDIDTIYIGIYQPRTKPANINMVPVSIRELHRHSRRVGLAVKAASEKNPPLQTGGHCRFCPARGVCPALVREAKALAEQAETDLNPLLDVLSGAEIADLLDIANRLKSWIPVLFDAVALHARAGRPIPGWALVPGRGSRDWSDPEAAVKDLRLMLSYEELFNRDMKSPAQIEKALKLKGLDPAQIEKYVIKTRGEEILKPIASDAKSDFDILN